MSEHTGAPRADVELRLPAEGAYASVVRTTAAGVAARLDFTIDDIEDLRIAIGEATALAIPAAEAMDEPSLDTESFAWQVLDTMAQDASAGSADGRFRVRSRRDLQSGSAASSLNTQTPHPVSTTGAASRASRAPVP